MKIKRIPNPKKVGEYLAFVTNFAPEDSNRLNLTLKDEEIKTLYINGPHADSFKPTRDIETAVVTRDELTAHLRDIKIPNWVQNQPNLDKILSGDYHDLKPVTAEFVPTLNCNYRCVQCSYAQPKKDHDVWLKDLVKGKRAFKGSRSPDIHMSEDVMKVSLDRLAEGGVRNILFTGGGEPLMNAHTISGMRHAKDNGNVIALYSNGRLLDERKAAEIVSLDPLFVRISIYGGNQETVARYTQTSDQSSLAKVIANVSNLASEKKKTGSDFNLGLSYLLHPITIDSIDEFAEKILGIDNCDQIDYIRFTPAVDYFHGQQHSQKLMEKTFNHVAEHIIPKFEDSPLKIRLYHHRLDDLNSEKSYSTCRASGWFAEVGPTGEMFLCCEKHFMPDYKIGDLTSQTLDEIWSGEERKTVIGKVKNSNCGDCPTLCKPHELNKIFDSVEAYRDRGEIALIDRWTKDLIEYGRECGFCPGKLDDFQS